MPLNSGLKMPIGKIDYETDWHKSQILSLVKAKPPQRAAFKFQYISCEKRDFHA